MKELRKLINEVHYWENRMACGLNLSAYDSGLYIDAVIELEEYTGIPII
jgi:hypothetical protein